MAEVFSEVWVAAWREAINASAAYRRAGERWEDTIAFVMRRRDDAAANGRGAFLDLCRGECRVARVATAGDLAEASFVVVSDPATWKAVLTGKLGLVRAIMQGRFRLTRGTLAAMLPHASAAHALLAAVDELDSSFPI
jgi:putative sterol carrier protein